MPDDYQPSESFSLPFEAIIDSFRKEAEENASSVVAIDAATGELLWTSADALTQYNAPQLVQTAVGPCALHARGGPHDVPERPVGVSLTRLTGEHAGEAVWRHDDPRGNHEGALQTMAHDERFAYWVLREPRSALVVLDLATGKLRWKLQAEGEIKSSPAVDQGVVYFGDEKGVFHAVDAGTGKPL